jgi:hypothetical protein
MRTILNFDESDFAAEVSSVVTIQQDETREGKAFISSLFSSELIWGMDKAWIVQIDKSLEEGEQVDR